MTTSHPYQKAKDLLLLLLVAVVIYWPVSFMVLSLKNDAINYFLAVRDNLSEAIHEGFSPWWSTYINLGYPLHGDMQSGVWNPFVLLLSAIRNMIFTGCTWKQCSWCICQVSPCIGYLDICSWKERPHWQSLLPIWVAAI